MPDVTRVEFEKARTKSEQRDAAGRKRVEHKPLKERIPTLDKEPRIDPASIKEPDQKALACANLRLAGAPFHEIAKELGYADAGAARSAYVSALSRMNPPEDLETLRQAATLRAETLFRQSLAMASADYLIDSATGDRIPNTDRLRWHEQAVKDLALHTTITGAKAPARLEVSATTQELNQMVHLLTQTAGEIPVEADVWEMAEIEAITSDIDEE